MTVHLAALGSTSGNDPIIYRGEGQIGPLGRQVEVLEDSTGLLSVHEAMLGTYRHIDQEVPNLGLSNSAYWLRLTIYNASPDKEPVLDYEFPEIDELEVYLMMGGELRQLYKGGTLQPDRQQFQDSPTFGFKLPITYAGAGSVYIRIRSQKQLQVPLFIKNERQSADQKLVRNLFMGGYMGIMLVMALYNLFVFLSIREKSYLIYILYIISVALTQLSLTGYGAYYFWHGYSLISTHSSATLTVITMLFAVEFMQRFINARQYIKHFQKVKSVVYFFAILGAVMGFLKMEIWGYMVIQATSAVMATYMMYASIKITSTGLRAARYFLAAWSVFVVGIIVYVAKDWGLLPYNGLTTHMMAIGSAVEVVLLSFGLADRINVLRREKEHSQAEALQLAQANARIIKDQNVLLEEKVKERTHALQESNDHLKRTQGQLVNAEKMASLGQLTAGIAHEINNPLNFISNSIPPLKRDLLDLRQVLRGYQKAAAGHMPLEAVQALEREFDVAETVKEVEDILSAMETGASRTSEIVRGLRTFSRLDEDDLKHADINENIRSTIVVLGPQLRDGIKVHYDLELMPTVECYPGKLNQLFMNLLNNAAHAARKRHGNDGGEVYVSTRMRGDQVVVTIGDNGIGMDESVLSHLFEPFFTTKDVGEGTGLGLSIVKGIVDKHHGQITVDSTVGQGTTFTLVIPAQQAQNLRKSA
ncbi:MAG TPA: 7TM diverse intracellular signaling domain-containing protein [Flavobacteriales bacterium]|nr:7TM diverse intracellular signaling domain-containing protein [Flavobacteriales bacterium]